MSLLAIVLRRVKAFNDRGFAYADLGEYQKAINDYDQAIALDPATHKHNVS
jgi:tetratricopeptide (TPR) repeat protein